MPPTDPKIKALGGWAVPARAITSTTTLVVRGGEARGLFIAAFAGGVNKSPRRRLELMAVRHEPA
jgi:hypothetical protein